MNAWLMNISILGGNNFSGVKQMIDQFINITFVQLKICFFTGYGTEE